jgi:hypothetical protein
LISRRASNASGIAGKGSDRTFSCCFFSRERRIKKKNEGPEAKKDRKERERHKERIGRVRVVLS